MSSKVSAPKVNSPDDVRNVVLIGNAGSGKTALFEQLLKSRVPGYRGEKDDPERLSQLYLASVAAGDKHVNLLDAPGHPDFVGELRAGIRAADAGVFVISASDGIDSSAAMLWEECNQANLPRVIVLTKLDAAHSEFSDVVSEIQKSLGTGVLPIYVPVMGKKGQLAANIDLIGLTTADYSSGSRTVRAATADESDLAEEHRGSLIEGVIQEAEDDALMDRYLEGEELDPAYLLADLVKAVATGNLYPLLPVLTATGEGIEELFSLIQHGLPSPGLHPNPPVTNLKGEALPAVAADKNGPLVAQVIRTTTDPFAGRLSMVRVFSGTLRPEDAVTICGLRGRGAESSAVCTEERIGQIQGAVGTELKPRQAAIAGEIVLLPKLATAETADTLSARDQPLSVAAWTLPEPLLPLAVKAATRNDEDKLSSALQRLTVEDSTVRLERSVTDQLVLWTTGVAHADLLLARLKERYGVQVEQEPLKIPLREALVGKTTALGRHVKQSGGHGQYAVCNIEVEPLERGGGFEFVDKVVGGAVPRQFIPSVEKGVRSQLEKGVIAGFPMVDVRVTLFDGKAHSVDSSDMAFQLAGANALKEAASKPGMTSLLEPIDLVVVTVGENYQGAVMNDLTGRRGQLLGTDSVNRKAIIRALVPQVELTRYAIDLRGLARGTGTFTREFHGYELMPNNLVSQYIKR